MNKNAYVTLVTKSYFFKGAINLYYSLLQSHSQYPFFIMVTDNIEIPIEYKNLPIKIIPHISFNDAVYYKDTINKFYCLNYEEYDQICFIDADCIIKSNPDILFNNSYEFIYQKLGNWINGAYFIIKPNKILYSKIIAEKDNYTTDEEILNHCSYIHSLRSKEQKHIDFHRHIKHFSGRYHEEKHIKIKYWDDLTLDSKILQNFSSHDWSILIDFLYTYNQTTPKIG